jgi:glycosyltransferase involved in cell wall biosynthesis
MKIGIVIGSLGFGGAEKVSTQLAEWFLQKGYGVSFYTTKKPPQKEYTISSTITRFDCSGHSNDVRLIACLRKTILKDKPNVVLVMDTPMCVYAVPALLGTGIPFVVSERSAPQSAAIKTKTRVLSRFLMNFASGFIFQTNGAKACFDKSIQKRSVVIPNPLVLSNLPDPYKGEREKILVAMGRLISAKNYPLMIEAFMKFMEDHHGYTLQIYGDGPEKEKLVECIRSNNAESYVLLQGSHSDVLNKVAQAGIFVLSSDIEGMPNALIEAMAIGIPCISTDCPSGGPADLLINGENGLLVPVGDASALSRAMSCFAEDPDLSKRVSSQAVLIRNKLDINRIGAQWENVLIKASRTNEI